MEKEILKAFGVIQSKTENSKVRNLMKPIKKDKGVNMPKFLSLTPNLVNQADILYMPKDEKTGDKYALVVVDVHNRYMDIKPLKNRTATTVLKNIKEIYKTSKLLKQPKIIQVDSGSEFKGPFKEWAKKSKIYLKVGITGRHRQQAIVENKNMLIGKLLFMRMNAEELKTGVKSNDWVQYLPTLLRVYNKKMKEKLKSRPTTKTFKKVILPVCKGNSCELLDVGQKVRIPLDEPRDIITKKKLHGKFRAGDIKWNPKVYKISDVFINPGQPPMYRVKGKKNVAYTRNQIQLYKENETETKAQTKYVVDKIIRKFKKKGLVYYEIKWKGYKKTSEEPRKELMKTIPLLIKKFEKENKK